MIFVMKKNKWWIFNLHDIFVEWVNLLRLEKSEFILVTHESLSIELNRAGVDWKNAIGCWITSWIVRLGNCSWSRNPAYITVCGTNSVFIVVNNIKRRWSCTYGDENWEIHIKFPIGLVGIKELNFIFDKYLGF